VDATTTCGLVEQVVVGIAMGDFRGEKTGIERPGVAEEPALDSPLISRAIGCPPRIRHADRRVAVCLRVEKRLEVARRAGRWLLGEHVDVAFERRRHDVGGRLV